MNKNLFQTHNKEVIKKFIKMDDDWLGYNIETNQQVISLKINNQSDCCESWGFLTTEDKLEEFLGAELLGIEVIDTDYKAHPLTKDYDFCDGGSACFVDLLTSNGKLQFAIYNDHNGYYGHDVIISSKNFNYDTVL